MEVAGFEPTSEGLRYTPLSPVETKSPPKGGEALCGNVLNHYDASPSAEGFFIGYRRTPTNSVDLTDDSCIGTRPLGLTHPWAI